MKKTQAEFDLMNAKQKAEFMAANMEWAAERDLKNELKLRNVL